MSGAPAVGVVSLTEMDGVGTGTVYKGKNISTHGRAVVDSLWTVMVVDLVMEPLRVAVQVYCPA